MNLTDVRKAPLGRKKKFRVGRGESSGLGKMSGRGHKGQKARNGVSFRPYFEGGQMPMLRRLPKRGFNNAQFRTEYVPVNVALLEKHFSDGQTVDPAALKACGLAKDGRPVKILGDGALSRKLTVKAHAFSKSAEEKIQKAGGTAEKVAVS